MFLNINPSNGIAIYDQIVRQVKFAVAQGAVKPGNLVPSVREMARELAINPNTVARAYQQLQADRVLEQVRGMGLEVAAEPRVVSACTQDDPEAGGADRAPGLQGGDRSKEMRRVTFALIYHSTVKQRYGHAGLGPQRGT